MQYMQALRFKPSAHWRLDDTAPFQDYSGYSRSATLTGTEKHGISLSSDTQYSQVFNRSGVAAFDSPVYVAGREESAFSMAATIYPVNKSEGIKAQTYKENLLNNPSGEGNLGWSSNNGASWTAIWDSTMPYVGSRSRRFNNITGTGNDILSMYAAGHDFSPQNSPKVTPGKIYRFSMMVRTDQDNCISRLSLMWRDSAGTAISGSQVYGTELPLIKDTWTKVTVFGVAPSGAAMLYTGAVVRKSTAAATTNYAWADAAILTEGEEDVPYFDGSTPGYEWSGEVNNSVSRTRTDVSRVNLARNPQPITTSGWGFPGGGAVEPAPWNSSRKAIRVTSNAINTPYVFSAGSDTKLLKGQTITVSATVDIPANCRYYFGGHQRTPNVYFIPQNYGSVTTAREVKRLSHTFVLAQDVEAGNLDVAFVYTGATGLVDGQSVYVGDILIETSDTARQYFDGADDSAIWSGTQHGSASYLLISNSEQQILSGKDRYDGLSINGTEISFSTRYLNSGEARCSYDIGMPRKVNVVGVHTNAKNSLYVDGVLVDEVDITPEQQADKYDSPDNKLYSGYTMSSQNILANEYSLYPRALHSSEIVSLHRAINDVTQGSIPKMFGGVDVPVSSLVRSAYLDTGWSASEDWLSATLVNTVVDGDRLMAAMESGVTVEGYWIDSIDIYNGSTPDLINSINIDWSGTNETVEASIDGINWSAVKKRENLSIIPTGFNPTNKALYIRVSFEAGNEEAYIESMRIRGYLTNTATSSGRTITYTNPVNTLDEYEPSHLRNDWGVQVKSGGLLSVGGGTSDIDSGFITLEIWIRPLGGAVLSRNFPAQAIYNNGVPDSSLPVGQWSLMHFVHNSGSQFTGTLQLGGDVQIGKVAIYDRILSASDCAEIYSTYTGRPKTRYDASANINIVEPSTSTKIYAHDWEILSA